MMGMPTEEEREERKRGREKRRLEREPDQEQRNAVDDQEHQRDSVLSLCRPFRKQNKRTKSINTHVRETSELPLRPPLSLSNEKENGVQDNKRSIQHY